MAVERRYGYERAFGGRHTSWPRRIWKNAVRIVEDEQRMAQCCFGIEKDGSVKLRPGNSGGLRATSGSLGGSPAGFDAEW